MDLATILSTEKRLLEPICTFSQFDAYTLYQSVKFQKYYGGNGIEIHTLDEVSLSRWEEIFRKHFNPDIYGHITFTFEHKSVYKQLVQEARDANYQVEIMSYMFADTTDLSISPPPEFEINKIENGDDWMRFAQFIDGDTINSDRFTPRAINSLFEKTRYVSEAIGIEWFYLVNKGKKEILSNLGIFKHNGICRLQDVITSPQHRRQKFASYLVSFAIGHALNSMNAAGLALCVNRNYHAIDLYRKLGFEEIGNTVSLMKYPTKEGKE